MNRHVFRSYDIRGVYGSDIDEQGFDKIGNALAQFSPRDILVARDARTHSEKLLNALMNGALMAEKTVQNIGEVPLPVAVDWAVSQQMTLAYVTASHLSKEWNGIKFFHSSGIGFSEEDYTKIRDLVLEESYFSGLRAVPVREETEDTVNLYIKHITARMPVTAQKRKIKVIIDCGNGTAGIVAKRLFTAAGFEADMIFEKPDGDFPNRMSDPKEDPLVEMKKKVGKYDFGIAFDGDADRFVVVTKSGTKLSPEQTAYVILSELLKERKGPIVANVECSTIIDDIAKKFQTEAIRCRVGHNFLMEAVDKNSAVFGMEFSGHYVVKHLTDFDDAIAAGLYFTNAVQKSGRPLEEILKEVPVYFSERVDFPCPDEKKMEAVERIRERMAAEYNVETMDGARIKFDDSWVLIRWSNTSPLVRLTVEAKSSQKLEDLKSKFSALVSAGLKF